VTRSRKSPNFGDGGRQPGQFYGVHSIATDSKGNLYTTETYEGKRVQKFVYKGIGAVRPRETSQSPTRLNGSGQALGDASRMLSRHGVPDARRTHQLVHVC